MTLFASSHFILNFARSVAVDYPDGLYFSALAMLTSRLFFRSFSSLYVSDSQNNVLCIPFFVKMYRLCAVPNSNLRRANSKKGNQILPTPLPCLSPAASHSNCVMAYVCLLIVEALWRVSSRAMPLAICTWNMIIISLFRGLWPSHP